MPKSDREHLEGLGIDTSVWRYDTMAKSDEGPQDKHMIIPTYPQGQWHIPVSFCFCRPRIVRWDRFTNIRVYVHPSIIH
jgi:hypothetical protein